MAMNRYHPVTEPVEIQYRIGRDSSTETELVPVQCRICGAPVAVLVPAEGCFGHEAIVAVARSKLGAVHNVCYDEHSGRITAAEILVAEQAKLTSWQTLCPVEFQKPLEWSYKSA